jgi:SAM-dependent methyltransferase
LEQTKIWDHFQNSEGADHAFVDSLPRYEFIAKHVPSGSSALDIGVGRGGLAQLLLEKQVTVSCLDPSAETIARLRGRLDLGGRAQVGVSQEIPFGDGVFDIVIMSEVLEHLSDEVLVATLREVRRVLKDGGMFIGTVPANERLADNRALCPHCGTLFHRWGHVQSFSPHRLRDAFASNGFSVQRLDTRAFPSWRRRGLRGFVKSTIRYALGRVGSPMASPHLFFKVARIAADHTRGRSA